MKKNATKRKDGRYMAYAVLSTGRKAIYADSEDLAVEKAVLLEEEEKEYLAKVKYTFANLYKLWFKLKLKENRPQSCDRIECTYNKYFKDNSIADFDLRNINNLYVINWLLDVSASPMTYKEYLRISQLLHGVYDFAVDCQGLPDVLNWERIKKNIPKTRFIVTKKKEYAVSEDTVQIISKAVKTDITSFNRPSAVALLYCNFYLGLRIGELAALRWSDIDFDVGVVRVMHTETKYHERDSDGNCTGKMIYNKDSAPKTRAGNRVLPLVPEVKDVLLMIKRYHYVMGYDSEYVAYDGGNAVIVRTLDKTLRKLIKQLGIPAFNSHKIRKTMATKLSSAGVPTREISDLLGHEEMETTEKNYIISIEQNFDIMRTKMIDAFNSYLGN